MSFIERYNLLLKKIEDGDYSFIRLNHQFFQIIFNFIEDKSVFDKILAHTTDPIIKTIIETFAPLAKVNYPSVDDNLVLRELRRGLINLEKILYNNRKKPDFHKLLTAIFSFVFLYDASYLNKNIRYLLTSWSQIFRNFASDSAIYTAPHTRLRGRKVGRIRIGFFSDRIFNFTSVFRDRGLIIKNLDRSKFEVFVFTSKAEQPEYQNEDEVYIKSTLDEVRKSVDKIVYLRDISRKTVEIIANYKLDIMVYPDIGMDSPTFYMAHSRLAPVQINTWGHSKTSGINTIDYYFSSKYFEVPDYETADSHYSERLITFDSLCTCYPKFPISRYFSK